MILFYFLAQDMGDRFWKWPEYTYLNLIYAIIILIVALIIYKIGSLFQRASNFKNRNWSILEAFARRNKLSSKEIRVLRMFFDSLPAEKQESLDFAFERIIFKNLLQKYLLDYKELEVEEKVRILDKLFPRKDHKIDVKLLTDLYEGEICALETETFHVLCHIVKISRKELLIAGYDWIPTGDIIGKNIKLYCYRPDIGGYILPGQIRALVSSGMVFAHSGVIETKGDQHLMADIQVPVEFFSWTIKRQSVASGKIPVIKPLPLVKEEKDYIELDDGLEPSQDEVTEEDEDIQDKIQETKTEIIIKGVTEKISDRAVLFSMKEGLPSEISRQDIWEMKLFLAGGMILKCRGNIVKSPGSGNYIFKFIDSTETMRRILFEEIKKNNPTREKFL